MELRHLRYFVAVAEERGFGRASKRLRVAQQALSRQIADLEREVGAMLLVRVHAGAQLTAAGVQFLGGARHVLAAAERTAEQARRAAADDGGVRVGCPDVGVAAALLREVAANFRTRRPDTPVVYDPAPPAVQQDRLRAGTLDVCFEALVRVGAEGAFGTSSVDPDFARERVTTEPLSAVMLPTSHAAEREIGPGAGPETTPLIACAALSGLPLLVARAMAPDHTDAMIHELWQRGWRGRVESAAGTAASLAALVAAGAGWLVVPRSAHGWTVPGTVRRDIAGGPVASVDTHAMWRGDGGQGAAAEFITVLHAHARRPCLAAPPSAAKPHEWPRDGRAAGVTAPPDVSSRAPVPPGREQAMRAAC